MDAMAKAVEDSFCVLICITEKYRESLNCQAEALYAFKLRKPMVPLIMQDGYENVRGWLGMVMGDKIFINFTKYKYDECIKKLQQEIRAIRAKSNPNLPMPATPDSFSTAQIGDKIKPIMGSVPNPPPPNNATTHTTIKQQTSINNASVAHVTTKTKMTTMMDKIATASKLSATIEKWSKEEVKQWFETNSIDKAIMDAIWPCEGGDLKQLYEMKMNAPEYYFQALDRNKSVELKSILAFNKSIDKLFKGEKV